MVRHTCSSALSISYRLGIPVPLLLLLLQLGLRVSRLEICSFRLARDGTQNAEFEWNSEAYRALRRDAVVLSLVPIVLPGLLLNDGSIRRVPEAKGSSSAAVNRLERGHVLAG